MTKHLGGPVAVDQNTCKTAQITAPPLPHDETNDLIYQVDVKQGLPVKGGRGKSVGKTLVIIKLG